MRSVVLSRSTCASPSDFEDVGESLELEATKGMPQTETIMSGAGGQVLFQCFGLFFQFLKDIFLQVVVARHLKLTLLSGHDHFCAVYRLVVTGEEATGAQIQQQQNSN